MKKQFLMLKGALSVSIIVLLLGAWVNHRDTGKNAFGKTQVADGVPLPPPINPPPKLGEVLVADGVPLPPPINPPPKLHVVLTADGVALPPPINPPPKLASR